MEAGFQDHGYGKVRRIFQSVPSSLKNVVACKREDIGGSSNPSSHSLIRLEWHPVA